MLWRTACFVTASALVLLLAHRVGRLQAPPRPASFAAEKSQVGPDMGPHDKARAGSVRMDQVVLFGGKQPNAQSESGSAADNSGVR